MADPEVIVRASRLTLGYGRHRVLEDVNLEIRADQFWFVVGPNGSGKTTLLRAMLGLLPPQSGELWLHPEHARRDCTGFVPQRSEFNTTLPTTVREFVLLGLAGAPLPRSQETECLTRALAQVGLAGMERVDYRALSGGQRQRALVARALVRRPHLLILDEPTSGLDVTAQATFLEYLRRLHADEHLTVVFVSHDLRMAGRHATHAALLFEGRLEAGTRREVLRPERLAYAYRAPLAAVDPGVPEGEP